MEIRYSMIWLQTRSEHRRAGVTHTAKLYWKILEQTHETEGMKMVELAATTDTIGRQD